MSEATKQALDSRWIREGNTEATWTTRDGRVLRIVDMSDNHLINTIRMLRRKYVAKLATTVAWYATCTGPQGDMASVAFDQEFDRLAEDDWRSVADPMFWQLVAESKRRPAIRDNAVEILGDDLRIEQTAVELSLLTAKELHT